MSEETDNKSEEIDPASLQKTRHTGFFGGILNAFEKWRIKGRPLIMFDEGDLVVYDELGYQADSYKASNRDRGVSKKELKAIQAKYSSERLCSVAKTHPGVNGHGMLDLIDDKTGANVVSVGAIVYLKRPTPEQLLASLEQKKQAQKAKTGEDPTSESPVPAMSSVPVPAQPASLQDLFDAHSKLKAGIKGASDSLRFLKQTKSIKDALKDAASEERRTVTLGPHLPTQLDTVSENLTQLKELLEQADQAVTDIQSNTVGAFNALNDTHYDIYKGLKDVGEALRALKQTHVILKLIQRQNNPGPQLPPLNDSEEKTLTHIQNCEAYHTAAQGHIREARDLSTALNPHPNLSRD